MYFRLLFLIKKELAHNSLEARQLVDCVMRNDDIIEMVDRDFYDSFSIGGMWTGTLTTRLLDQEKLKAFDSEVQKQHGWKVERCKCFNDDKLEKKQKALQIFLKYFPDLTGEPPFFRDEYTHMGYEDDALLITNERQYYKLLNNYEGEWLSQDNESVEMFNFSQCIVNPENIINKHWVVVVNCHC